MSKEKAFTVHTGKDYRFTYKLHGQDGYMEVVEVQGISVSVTETPKKIAGSIILAISNEYPQFHDDLVDHNPMDIILRSINEIGVGLQWELRNLRMTHFGVGLSVDDTSNEIQYTYTADSVKLSNVKV